VDSKAVFQLTLSKYNERVALCPDCSPDFVMYCMWQWAAWRGAWEEGYEHVEGQCLKCPETYPDFISHLLGFSKLYLNMEAQEQLQPQ